MKNEEANAALRGRAQKELGPKFDHRAFHDAVVDQGPLSLDVLETEINEWIATQKKLRGELCGSPELLPVKCLEVDFYS